MTIEILECRSEAHQSNDTTDVFGPISTGKSGVMVRLITMGET